MKPSATFKLPLKVTVSLDEGDSASVESLTRSLGTASEDAVASEPSAGLRAFRANAQRLYYDAALDAVDRGAYYNGIDWTAGAEALFRQISAKLRDTHTQQPGYKPSVELYPWVDLQPDRSIRSIYSGHSSSPEAFILHDEQVDEARQASLNQHLAAEGTAFAPLAARIESLEASLPYNCEHSVPQSWFKKKSPMRGDLHHLFACETQCNSTRGNQPYFEHSSTPGGGNDCGISGTQGFEPKGGKGVVARATLYFLLRYPSIIGDAERELQVERISLLLQWHRDYPVSEYELHRNQAIFQRQGNRNPLIDFPDNAHLIGFEQGFGNPPRQRDSAEMSTARFAEEAAHGVIARFPFGQPRPLSLLNAQAEMLDVSAALAPDAMAEARARSRFKPLPAAPGAKPYRLKLADILGASAVADIEQAGQLVFHSVGDTGQHGHGAEAQESVAFHMEQQVKSADAPDKAALFYHLGDVIYYSGESKYYPEQFYDPYNYYPGPIVAIPGNHDGDNVPSERSLASFVKNFCTLVPRVPSMPGDSSRLTMIQPNVYFTLLAPFATIIGLYSNVTGELDDPNSSNKPQFDWLVGELKAADPTKFIIVAVHHPAFSADNDHGSEKKIGLILDEAFKAAKVLPHIVLAAHVHDYQRFERKQAIGSLTRTIPYLVAGAGGYAGFDSLHRVHQGAQFPAGIKLVKSNGQLPGFLRITVSANRLRGEYFLVPRPPKHIDEDTPAMLFDEFEITR